MPSISPTTAQSDGGSAKPGQGAHIDSMIIGTSTAGHGTLDWLNIAGVRGTGWMAWMLCLPLSTPRSLLIKETSLYRGVRSMRIVDQLYGGKSDGM